MDHPSDRIGPNAVTRLAEAARVRLGEAETRALFAAAGLGHHLDRPPEAMVAEGEVVALHRALATRPAAIAIAADAGQRTARYLLGHRIPRAVQLLLRVTPAALAARVLLGAIGRHAWTFAGTGAFSASVAEGAKVRVDGGPFADPGAAAAPLAAFYAAVFDTLFRALVSRRARAEARAACGACAVTIRWRERGLAALASPASAR